ncbi:metal-dependent hydrolase [Gilvimarinus sp. F26214L]|uniref:metal-dependent hydrolase n=1 Tax=Gilvimarinus sp. DZF01 TaxID=3461371 RepID=UPI0040465335
MDPISQAALGAAAAQAATKKARLLGAAVLGGLAGMAADLDVFIRSAEDPLLFLEYHRQFTHSLFFIPIGGLLCGLLAYGVFRRRWGLRLRESVLWSTLGYATHGLLDGCTSYGTQLLWPLSDARFAWDLISVVDPLFTVPLVVLVIGAASRQARHLALAGLTWAGLYLLLGYFQHERALAMGRDLAKARQHEPVRLEAKPSFANIVVWKVIYESGGRYYVDAVRPGIFGGQVWEGESLAKLNPDRDLPWLDPNSQQRRDLERFDWFSAGYTALDPEDPLRVIDVRYSLLPHRIDALWGIELNPDAGPNQHVDYYTQRENSREAASKLWSMLVR